MAYHSLVLLLVCLWGGACSGSFCLSLQDACLRDVFKNLLRDIPHVYLLKSGPQFRGIEWFFETMAVNFTTIVAPECQRTPHTGPSASCHLRALNAAQKDRRSKAIVAEEDISFEFLPLWRHPLSHVVGDVRRGPHPKGDLTLLAWHAPFHRGFLSPHGPLLRPRAPGVRGFGFYAVHRSGLAKLAGAPPPRPPPGLGLLELLEARNVSVLQSALPYVTYHVPFVFGPAPACAICQTCDGTVDRYCKRYYRQTWMNHGWPGPWAQGHGAARADQRWGRPCVDVARGSPTLFSEVGQHFTLLGHVDVCSQFQFSAEAPGATPWATALRPASGQPDPVSAPGTRHPAAWLEEAPLLLVMGDSSADTPMTVWVTTTNGTRCRARDLAPRGRIWRWRAYNSTAVYALRTGWDTDDDFKAKYRATVLVHDLWTGTSRTVPAKHCSHEVAYDPFYRLWVCTSENGIHVLTHAGKRVSTFAIAHEHFFDAASPYRSYFTADRPVHLNSLQLDLGRRTVLVSGRLVGPCLLRFVGRYEGLEVAWCATWPMHDPHGASTHSWRRYNATAYSFFQNDRHDWDPATDHKGKQHKKAVRMTSDISAVGLVDVGGGGGRAAPVTAPTALSAEASRPNWGGDALFVSLDPVPTALVLAGRNSFFGRGESRVLLLEEGRVSERFVMQHDVYAFDVLLPGTPFFHLRSKLGGVIEFLLVDCRLLPTPSHALVQQFDGDGQLVAAVGVPFASQLLSMALRVRLLGQAQYLALSTTNCVGSLAYDVRELSAAGLNTTTADVCATVPNADRPSEGGQPPHSGGGG